MAADKETAKNLSEAIAELEKFANSKSADAKEIIQKELADFKKTLNDLKPQLEKLKETVSNEASEAKKKAEEKVKENPLMALGIVALVALIIGWILGHSKKD